MWWLIGRLVLRFSGRVAGSRAGVIAGVAVTAVTLNDLRQAAIVEAPQSDPAALEEAARTAARLLGLQGDEILWPVHGRRHAQAGEPINPRYLVVDLHRGRGWFMESYTSRRAMRRAQMRGWSRGTRAGERLGLQRTQAYAKG